MHTFWRRWLAGQRCKLDVEEKGASTDLCGTPYLRRRNQLLLSFPVVRVNCDCQPSQWSCGRCVYQAAIAASCMWGCGAIQCRRLLWGRQAQHQSSYLKSYPRCPVLAGWPSLWPTSRIGSPPAPEIAVGRWLIRHECWWVLTGAHNRDMGR